MNLISNALKFTSEGGVTDRNRRRRPPSAPRASTDTGVGIAPAVSAAHLRALQPGRREPHHPALRRHRHRAGLRQGDRRAARRAHHRRTAPPARAAPSWSICPGAPTASPSRRATYGSTGPRPRSTPTSSGRTIRSRASGHSGCNAWTSTASPRSATSPTAGWSRAGTGVPPLPGPRVLLVEDNVEILELVNLQLRDKYIIYAAQTRPCGAGAGPPGAPRPHRDLFHDAGDGRPDDAAGPCGPTPSSPRPPSSC